MKGSEIKTEDIAEKIASLIVEQNYISKKDLIPKINAYLKAFVKVQSIPKFHPRDLKQEAIYQQKKEAWVCSEQKSFYSSKLSAIIGIDEMAKLNKDAEAFREAYDISQLV